MRPPNEIGWLIERPFHDDRPEYWAGESHTSTDAKEAIRFARKADAERMIERGGRCNGLAAIGWKAVEHMWEGAHGPKHCCGAQGFGQGPNDVCPACAAESAERSVAERVQTAAPTPDTAPTLADLIEAAISTVLYEHSRGEKFTFEDIARRATEVEEMWITGTWTSRCECGAKVRDGTNDPHPGWHRYDYGTENFHSCSAPLPSSSAIAEKPRCEACRQVGAFHCANPDECGNMAVPSALEEK